MYGQMLNENVVPATAEIRRQQVAFQNYRNNVVAPMMNRQIAIGAGVIIGTGLTLRRGYRSAGCWSLRPDKRGILN